MIPVVMSGGVGTRLWPISRKKLPKQLCDFLGDSLLGKTLQRLEVFGSPWILTTQSLAEGSTLELRRHGLPLDNLILEPFGRNTAAAIALLCKTFEDKGWGDQVVGVFPADHLILNSDAFVSAVRLAESRAKNGPVVTLGVKPSYPATGFGYIETNQALISMNGLESLRVQAFREKPDRANAERFLSAGNFFWNAGVFVFRVDRMLEHIQRLLPEITQGLKNLKSDRSNLEEVYRKLPSISIDYGVMEKLEEQECVPSDMEWTDLGSWDDVAMLFERGVLKSEVNLAIPVAEKSNGCFVFSDQSRPIGLVGVDDLIVIDTEDALLITQKGQSQNVRAVVEELEKKEHPSIVEHKFEVRPWGRFEILRDEPHYKSKKITINVGAQISYQSHSKRSEHWIIVKGSGDVILDEKTLSVNPGSSVFIPPQAKHRIRNTGLAPLEFIEVQTGTYFGEDDIVRYQDDYQRT